MDRKVRRKTVDGVSSKVVGHVLVAEILYSMIPAIREINVGQYGDVRRFVETANAGLERIGAKYRYEIAPRDKREDADDFDYIVVPEIL